MRENKKIKERLGLVGFSRRVFLSASLALSALLVSGCSSVQVVYFFTEGIVQERAKFYLDLSSEEEVLLAEESAALIKWHRKTMLPKYAAFLRAQANMAKDGGWSRRQMAESVSVGKIFLVAQRTASCGSVCRGLFRIFEYSDD